MSIFEEGDTFESFFHFLWVRDAIYQNYSFDFKIPDTLIIKNDAPSHWYFTSKGIVKKKKSQNITLDKIFAAFSKTTSPTGAIATFVHAENRENDSNETNGVPQKRIFIEYLGAEELSKDSF